MKKWILFGLMITALVSCNEKQQTTTNTNAYNKNVSINYYLRTDDSDFIVAEVYARHENDTIPPMIESVVIEGRKMLEHEASRKDLVRFKFGEVLPKAKTYEIKVKPKGFDEVTEVLTPNPIENVIIKEGKISKSSGFTLSWEGVAANAQNETLVILITDVNGNSMSLNHLGNAGKKEIFIDAVQLTYFAPGMATIYLVRKNKINLPREGYIEETIELEHYTPEQKIEIVE